MASAVSPAIPSFVDRLYGSGAPKLAVVGLDPHIPRIVSQLKLDHQEEIDAAQAAEIIMDYNKLVIDSIADTVGVVKLQMACYERYGTSGMNALDVSARYARDAELIVILDGKRGDIPETSRIYAEGFFQLDKDGHPYADAATVAPYLGRDSVEPFVEVARRNNAGVFVCVKTSNVGARDVQDLAVRDHTVADEVASMVTELNSDGSANSYGAVGAVTGATHPSDAPRLRTAMRNSILLVPGIGAQGGDPELLHHFFNADGLGALVNASRSVIFPAGEPGRSLGHHIKTAAQNLVSITQRASKIARSASGS
jgi:orotidine-5'-phosphate decarboxylase